MPQITAEIKGELRLYAAEVKGLAKTSVEG
jgi:hypothetical protein